MYEVVSEMIQMTGKAEEKMQEAIPPLWVRERGEEIVSEGFWDNQWKYSCDCSTKYLANHGKLNAFTIYVDEEGIALDFKRWRWNPKRQGYHQKQTGLRMAASDGCHRNGQENRMITILRRMYQ